MHLLVYGYRMSLWAEHMGSTGDCFKNPEKLNCVAKVNSIANDNWQKFIADEFSPLQGHILKYLVQADADGKISPLPGFENFPEFDVKFLLMERFLQGHILKLLPGTSNQSS